MATDPSHDIGPNSMVAKVLRAETAGRVGRSEAEDLGLHLSAGSDHYRAWVGPPAKYDLLGALQFQLLTNLGLREYHFLCEVGCGSLRAARLFIPYLLDGRYCAIEPSTEILEQGLRQHFGWHGPDSDVLKKRPRFLHCTDFDIASFGVEFDFVLAQSILSHTGPSQTGLFFRQCRRAMGPSTVVVFTFVRGKVDCSVDGWYYPTCVTYSEKYMSSLANQNDLVLELVEWPMLNHRDGGPVSGQTVGLLRRL